MTAIIAASCTFPSGPTLALADIAHRLQFALIRKHPQWVDLCQFPIKACFYPELGSSPLTVSAVPWLCHRMKEHQNGDY